MVSFQLLDFSLATCCCVVRRWEDFKASLTEWPRKLIWTACKSPTQRTRLRKIHFVLRESKSQWNSPQGTFSTVYPWQY